MGPRRVTIGSTDSAFDGIEARYEDAGGNARARRIDDPDTPFDGPWYRRGLLIALVAALAALPLAALAIAVFVDSDEVAAWLAPRMSGVLNREVTIGGAGISVLPRPGLRLSAVRIGGPAEAELPSIAVVRDVRLDASLLPLLTGRVNVGRVRLAGLDVHLAVSQDGTSNFGDLVPESEVVEVAREAPVGFAVSEIEVEDGSLTYFDGRRDRSFAVIGGRATLGITVAPDGNWVVTGDAAGDSLHLRFPRITDEIVRTDAPSLRLTARGDRTLGWVEVGEGVVEQWGETLTVTGRIDGLSDVDPSVDLRFANPAFDVGALTALIPAEARSRSLPALDGTLDVGVRIRGNLRAEDSPALRGNVRLQGVAVRLGGTPLLSDLHGRIGLGVDAVRLDSIAGVLADGPFRLDGEYDRTTRAITVSVEGSPDLDRLRLAPFGSTLAGEADVVLAVSGPLAALDSLTVTGTIHANGVQAEHDRIGVPLYVASADLELTDADVRWSEVTVMVGTDPLTTTGRLRGPLAAWWLGDAVPEIEGSLTGPRLDLGAVLPPDVDEPDATYARIAFAHLGGREIEGSEARRLADRAGFTRPETLPLHGSLELSLEELRYRSHDLRGVSALLVLGDSVLAVRDATFAAWDGAVVAALELGVGDRSDEPFALGLTTEDVDAVAFLSRMTPIGDAVTGRLALDVDVSGTVDRSLMPLLAFLDADGTLTVTDGRVAGTGVNLALADFLAMDGWTDVPFSTWTTDFAIREGMLDVTESVLDGDFAGVTLSGAVGLGGAVDLAMALSIPPDQLQAVSLRRTGVAQTVLDRLRETGSSLDLGIRVSGTLEGPTLEPDALAASERLAAVGR